jgi:hypothetical protein
MVATVLGNVVPVRVFLELSLFAEWAAFAPQFADSRYEIGQAAGTFVDWASGVDYKFPPAAQT